MRLGAKASFQLHGNMGGVITPRFLANACENYRGQPSKRGMRKGNVFFVVVLNLKMQVFLKGQLTWQLEARGFCTSIQLISFSWETFWNPWKPEDYYLGIPGPPKNKLKQTHTNTHPFQDMTPIHRTIAVLFSLGAVSSGSVRVRPLDILNWWPWGNYRQLWRTLEPQNGWNMLELKFAHVYAWQGVPTAPLARFVKSIHQKWFSFRVSPVTASAPCLWLPCPFFPDNIS